MNRNYHFKCPSLGGISTKRGINDRVFRYIICNSIPVFKDSLTNLSYPSFYPNFGKNSILQYSGSDEKKMCYD